MTFEIYRSFGSDHCSSFDYTILCNGVCIGGADDLDEALLLASEIKAHLETRGDKDESARLRAIGAKEATPSAAERAVKTALLASYDMD